MYQQIAKLIQELLQSASVSASRQNSQALSAVHAFLDRLQSGELTVGTPPKPRVKKAKEPAA